MKKSISNVKVGDSVYHLSNRKLTMVIVEINADMNEVTCRWLDSTGNVQKMQFMPEELGDADDLRPTITFGTI